MSLKNVLIIVDNIDESIDFYEELFGLRVITRLEGNVIMSEKKPLTIQPIKCVVMLSSDEEHDCIAAEKKEDKQLKRIMEFADNNNLIPMKIFRRGIFGRRLRDEVFYKAIRYMRAGKADALIVTNLDAISDGIADSYLKIGAVREAGFRLFSVDEKEPKVDLYIPPKRGDLQ